MAYENCWCVDCYLIEGLLKKTEEMKNQMSIKDTAKRALDAEAANHPTPQTFMVGPEAMRRTATLAATAPELARFATLVDQVLTECVYPNPMGIDEELVNSTIDLIRKRLDLA